MLAIIFSTDLSAVHGPSMEPALSTGDIVVTNWVVPLILGYQRHDIVAIRNSRDHDLQIIKRIAGLPGETTADTEDGIKIFSPSGELALHTPGRLSGLSPNLSARQVPDGAYFFLGDNRDESSDSRMLGVAYTRNILGKVYLVYSPSRGFRLPR